MPASQTQLMVMFMSSEKIDDCNFDCPGKLSAKTRMDKIT